MAPTLIAKDLSTLCATRFTLALLTATLANKHTTRTVATSLPTTIGTSKVFRTDALLKQELVKSIKAPR